MVPLPTPPLSWETPLRDGGSGGAGEDGGDGAGLSGPRKGPSEGPKEGPRVGPRDQGCKAVVTQR